MGHNLPQYPPGTGALLAAGLSRLRWRLAAAAASSSRARSLIIWGSPATVKKADVRMAERAAACCCRPTPRRFPQPQNGVAAAAARQDWPTNPEATQEQMVQAEKDKKAAEDARRIRSIPISARQTLLDSGSPRTSEGPPVEEVPEPDPSDKPPARRCHRKAEAAQAARAAGYREDRRSLQSAPRPRATRTRAPYTDKSSGS